MNTISYQDEDYHYKYETFSRLSHFMMGIFKPRKDGVYIGMGPCFFPSLGCEDLPLSQHILSIAGLSCCSSSLSDASTWLMPIVGVGSWGCHWLHTGTQHCWLSNYRGSSKWAKISDLKNAFGDESRTGSIQLLLIPWLSTWTGSVPWLLMPWLLTSPGSHGIGHAGLMSTLSSTRKGFNSIHHLDVEIL